MEAHTMGVYMLLISVLLGTVCAQTCKVNIVGNERRDCYPWTNAAKDKCEERGCVWCDDSPGYPSCFYNDKVCPSTIPDSQRQDCHPEADADKQKCNAKGCIWCGSSTPGVPWCFTDSSVSQGGEVCPADIKESERVDCHPEANADKNVCIRRGCFWCQSQTPNVPWCFSPKQTGYRMVGQPVQTAKGWQVSLQRQNSPSLFGKDISSIQMDVEFQTDNRLRIKIFDPNTSRWEVPVTITSAAKASNPLYDVQFSSDPVFSFKVTRRSNGQVIFDTSIGGLVFSDQYLQFATNLASPIVSGFGEHEHKTYIHDVNWKTWTMWSRDLAVQGDANFYGVHPFYMNVESGTNAHGVFIKNSNAQEVTLQPKPALTYRTIGGVLDLYIFMGPSAEGVVQQYHEAIGRPVMPPYWTLGFHLSRWGYTSLDHMKAAVARMRQYDIPQDVQVMDIDYMDGRRIFTISPAWSELPAFVKQLQQQGTKFTTILDPGISNTQQPGTYPTFDSGEAMDVWVKEIDGVTSAVGKVWPGTVYFPDYTKPVTSDWWIQETTKFKTDKLDIASLWIDMNEPANFFHGTPDGTCPNTPINYPPYIPKVADGKLHQKTLCGETRQALGIHYDVHSLYGWSMMTPSYHAARNMSGLRSHVYSRSTYPGCGKYGSHWLGDNFSTWSSLKNSIIGVMEFNMFGFPWVGADICGFINNAEAQMCQRWHQLGAFYPFSRNHNAENNNDQDPGVWGAEMAGNIRYHLHIRYTLLPFLYTLMHQSHINGGTVARHLMHEFMADSNTYSADSQFLWGSSFLISPVVSKDTTTVRAYFPDARWFSYYDGQEVSVRGQYLDLDAPLTFIPLHVRGGSIIPTQEPANSTDLSRTKPLGLIVAGDDGGKAAGSLFWDDGQAQDTYENGVYFDCIFQLKGKRLTNTIRHNGYRGVDSLIYKTVHVFGETSSVIRVTVNGQTHSQFTQNPTTKELSISGLSLPVKDSFTISWNGSADTYLRQ